MKFGPTSWRALALLVLGATTLPAQGNPAKRLSSIVSVAVEEYSKAFDDAGKLVAPAEYAETTDFLRDAKDVAGTLKSYSAAQTRAILDTLTAAVAAKRPVAEIRAIHARFGASLGRSGAIDLPSAPLDTAEGHRLYSANCASCHGDKGFGEGPGGHGLAIRPPGIGSRDSLPDMTPALAFNVISVGITGTPMAAYSESLTPQQRWNVVKYVYALRGEPMQLPTATQDVTSVDAAAQSVMSLLDSALAFAILGKNAEAGDRAFDAYIAFEPLETPVRAKKPALVSSMERHFADFKGAVRRNDMEGARNARNSIEAGIPEVLELARKQSGGLGSFFQSLLIILREGFEAILVIGAVVAFLIKTGHRERLRSIWVGAILGVLASFGTAFLLKGVFAYMPGSREIVEGVTMLIAVVVLFSVSYWLISKVEAAKWQQFIREKVNRSLEEGGGKALALVSFLAVYREGAETALFYQALFSEGNVAVPLSLGILAGFGLLAVIFTLFYRFGIRIPMRPFFTATSVLLYFMAFIFMGKGISELQEANVVSITMLPGFPHVPSLGIFPSLETVAAQGLLIALFIFAIVKTWSGSRVDSGSTGANVSA
jgi:high-affinity iron transporter